MIEQIFTKVAKKIWLGVDFFHLKDDGASRGLAIMWNPNVLMGREVLKEKKFSISKFSNDRMVWNLVNIYAPNTRVGRGELWDKIGREMGVLKNKSLMCMGDFNTPLIPLENAWGNH